MTRNSILGFRTSDKKKLSKQTTVENIMRLHKSSKDPFEPKQKFRRMSTIGDIFHATKRFSLERGNLNSAGPNRATFLRRKTILINVG